VLLRVVADGVFVAAQYVDRIATHAHVRSGNLAAVDRVAYGDVRAACALGAHVTLGGEAGKHVGLRGGRRSEHTLRHRLFYGLQVFRPRVKKEMNMRVSCNAIDILGGHEDAIGYNPEQHVLSNADVANSAQQLIEVIRAQRKGGADFTKIYETGPDSLDGNNFSAPYQFTEAELTAAVNEAHRTGSRVAVHCTAEPGASYAAHAGVASIDHAYQLAPETERIMREKQIYAVPTFTIMEYFSNHPEHPADAARYQALLAYHAAEFKKQLAAGVPFALGTDVGPFPHGTQAREFELMVKYGMTPLDVLRSDLINGAKLLDWADRIGQLKPGFDADIIAVPGDPLTDIGVLKHPVFVMKEGYILRRKPLTPKSAVSAQATPPAPAAN
jgi:hypothetical protein